MRNMKFWRTALVATLVLTVMLSVTGGTIAWFTDTVTSGNNVIKSGTLEVTMEWKDATKNGKQQTYKDASEGAIFNYDLWEPGYVEAKNIKISNAGTLAFKYALNVVANGEVSILADVIDVYFAEGEMNLTSRDMTGLTKVGTLSEVLAGMPAKTEGDLLKKEETDTVTIALKMQETAGNDYQNKAIGTNFSVKLEATQLTHEQDSFDNQYDADAELPWNGTIPEMTFADLDYKYVLDSNDPRYVVTADSYVTVSNAAELLWVMQNADEIKSYLATEIPNLINAGWGSWTIKLGTDIDFNNFTIAPMEMSGKVFDGQGHTIENVTIDGKGAMAGLFKWNGGTIQNLTVSNVTVVNGGDGTGAIAGGGGNYINVTAKDISVTGNKYVGGISGYYGTTYTNCSVTGMKNVITAVEKEAGGIAGFLNTDTTDTITLTNCKVENAMITAPDEVGGIVGRAVALGTTDSITLTGCTTNNVSLQATSAEDTYKGVLVGRNYGNGNVSVVEE